jgi:hypothetical protein
MTFHPKGLIVFALFLAALNAALFSKWGIIAVSCIILIEWVLVFAGGWGRWSVAKPGSRPWSH